MSLATVQPERYQALFDAKVEALLPAFAALGAPEPLRFASRPEGFRMRAEFRIWHEGDRSDYAMFDPSNPRVPVVVDRFPIASDTIQALMPRLKAAVEANPILRRKLFQVEFLTGLSGEALITLIYHRPLDDDWAGAARDLETALGVAIVGRSRKQKMVLSRDWIDEVLHADGRHWTYRQPEQAFTQPNAGVNQHMLDWACAQAANSGGDLLELYCGIGNFTLPLARHFNRVLATELSKPATAAAEHNRQINGVTNVDFARLSAEEMTEALAGQRTFRRLAQLAQPLADFRFETLFVDPPRAGLDTATEALATNFNRVLYISCNPKTLLNNLKNLVRTHRIDAIAAFDQFPYTDHLECGVALTRR